MKKLTAIISLILVSSLFAQNNLIDVRFEQNENREVTYLNMIYARTIGNGMVLGWHMESPISDKYKENAIGGGYNFFNYGDVAVYGISLLARATDEDYFQKGALAVDVSGKLTGQLFAIHFSPLDRSGLKQILVDPLEVQYNFWGPLSAGASIYFWKAEGLPEVIKTGGKVSTADNLGSTDLVIRKVNNREGWELRLKRIFVF